MRWNCPHCEELVTAGIDFEATKQAYVRCGKCGGMAILHRSAALAGFVKARRLEEEAQMNAEIKINEARKAANDALATARAMASAQALALAEVDAIARSVEPRIESSMEFASGPMSTPAQSEPRIAMPPLPTVPPRNGNESSGIDMTAVSDSHDEMEALMTGTLPYESEITVTDLDEVEAASPTPPPYRGPRESRGDTIAAAAPIFAYPRPPAFLMKDPHAESMNPAISAALAAKPKLTNNRMANLAVWIAAALAISSGIYLYIQGKKALSATAPISTIEGDQIISKASSGVRAEVTHESRNVGIVKVPRAIVRGAPSIDSAAVGSLDQASLLTLLEEKEGWIRIESPKLPVAAKAGAWVRSDLIAKIAN